MLLTTTSATRPGIHRLIACLHLCRQVCPRTACRIRSSAGMSLCHFLCQLRRRMSLRDPRHKVHLRRVLVQEFRSFLRMHHLRKIISTVPPVPPRPKEATPVRPPSSSLLSNLRRRSHLMGTRATGRAASRVSMRHRSSGRTPHSPVSIPCLTLIDRKHLRIHTLNESRCMWRNCDRRPKTTALLQ